MIECAFQGRCGKTPERSSVKGGTVALLTFDVCVMGRFEDPGEPRWIRVSLFGALAEQLVLEKGMPVYVEGRLSWAIWQPGDGRPPSASMRVNATLVQPLGQIGRRRPPEPRQRPRQPTQQQDRRDPPPAGFVRAWSQERETTPFYDDSAAAISDLEGRGR